MNPNVAHLFAVAQQPARRIIGLMSGTSLDGLDVALCQISGHGRATRVVVEHFATVPYTAEIQARIRQVFAQPQVSLETLCLLNPWLGRLHARMVLDCLQAWHVAPTEVDCIASHGQTIFHAPQRQHGLPIWPDATLQLGDGDHIAVHTGILTISDFRQKHVAAGGEGAPLAGYGDFLLLAQPGEERLLLNLGGIANFTYLPGSDDATALFSTDTGPGNTLLDAFTRQLFPGKNYDEDGQLAAQGQVHEPLLRALLHHPFFEQTFPKTTGPEVFNPAYVQAALQQTGNPLVQPTDLLATLTQFSAASVARAVNTCFPDRRPLAIYASGGGAHNPVLMQALQQQLPQCSFGSTAALGVHPDAKEAVLFAVIANETLVGRPDAVGTGRPGMPAVCMGKISFPS